ncbi:MAG: hypothetical protein LBR14_04225 [Clostridiales Family XIII bacterium]|nr:hypothetical protein [Clostridiales Family XIII bacterium]
MKILAVTVVLAGAVAGNELITKKTRYPMALSRKVIHVLSTVIVCAGTWFMDYRLYAIVGAIFVPLTILFRRKAFKSLADRSEASYGEVALPVGIALAALLPIGREGFILSVLFMGLSDTAGYAAGKWLKRPRLLFGKTLPGSLAFFLSALIICLPFGLPLPHAGLLAAVGAVTELASPYGLDNATVPPLTGLVFMLL